MPRGGISTPKDSVATIFSQSREGAAVSDIRQQQDNAWRRDQYAQDLRAQILDKEADRRREKANNNAISPPTNPLSQSPFASAQFQGDAAEQAPSSLPAKKSPLPSNEENQLPLTKVSLPPIQTRSPPLSEKDKFIAAMESGLSPAAAAAAGKSHRSMTAPPLLVHTVSGVVATPLGRTRSAEEEALETLLRQQHFKDDLQHQINEKKRLQALEKERERQWEAEEEARLEKEREQLRIQFEAEHAARRAKLAAETAAAASPTSSSGGGAGIQIFAPVRKPSRLRNNYEDNEESNRKTTEKQQTATINESFEATLSGSEERRSGDAAVPAAGKQASERTPPAASKSQNDQIEDVLHASAPPPPPPNAALAEQIAELRQLHEALRRDLSLHQSVLELVKDTKLAQQQHQQQQQNLAAASSLLPLAAAAPPQPPVYINPALHYLQLGHSHPPPQRPPPPPALPIIYTSSELRTEDSRPSSRHMSPQVPTALGVQQRSKQHHPSHLGGGVNRASNKRAESPPAPRTDTIPAMRASNTTSSNSSSSRRMMMMPRGNNNNNSNSKKAELGKLTKAAVLEMEEDPEAEEENKKLATATLPPARAAQRLSLWKKATKTLKTKKLSVAPSTAAQEARWVEEDQQQQQ